MAQGPDLTLYVAAEEELEAACTLGWRALASVTPWGDTYEGFVPGGRAVLIERNYIWKTEEGGDILVEIAVYPGPSRYDSAARASRVIEKD